MGKAGKKPRKKMTSLSLDAPTGAKKKKEDEWSFEDIARSKVKRR